MKYLIQLFIAVLVLTHSSLVFSQSKSEADVQEPIKTGTILTSFNIDVMAASKDENYNQEFERSFELVALNFDGMYFVTQNIGVGPVFGVQYVHRFYDAPGVIFQDEDEWNWQWEYGAKAGYYVPFRKIFKTEALGNSKLFATSGISWVNSKIKYEVRDTGQSGTLNPEPQFRYQLGAGLFVPLGNKVGLEWKLQSEVWQRDYLTYELDNNDNIIGTGETTKWLSELSLGLGLKVKF